MRIGLVLPASPGYSETFFRSKITGLANRGYKFILFVGANHGKTVENSEIKKAYPIPSNYILKLVFSLFVIGWLLIKCTKRVLKFYRLQRSDGQSFSSVIQSLYVNAHILPYNLDWLHFGFATMGIGRENVARAMGAKTAVSIRGFDISIYPLKYPGCYNLLWKNTDKVHVISDDLEKKLRETGFSKSKVVEKITPAIDFKRFYYPRESYELNNPVKILSVGRLHWKKGYEYALQSLSVLKSEGISFVFSIVGEGSELERLKFAVYQLNLQEEVLFRGKISHYEVAKEMRETDIYIQPSIQEGFCNAVLEAQASGCYCIVSDAEGLRENVIDKITGRVFQRRDSNAMADRIKEAICLSKEERAFMVEAAQKRVQDIFTIDSQIKKFYKFYSNA